MIVLLILLGLSTIVTWIWMISILRKVGYEETKTINDHRYLLRSIPAMVALIITEQSRRLRIKYLTILLVAICSVLGLLATLLLAIPARP
ncbi:MAG: hypothetical protein K1X47_12500 [Cyclobacteriaceae bacterium]|nr:hypothetical protein [Cyclobacteriaceae bacterium]